MFRTRGINHIAFVTKDMDATVKFYTEVMNFPLVVTSFLPDLPGKDLPREELIAIKHYFFDCGDGNNIAFFTWHDGLPPGYEGMNGGAHHIAFSVRTEAELDDARAHMQSKGAHVSPVLDHGYLKSIYSRDPNGIVVEISAFVQPCSAEHPHLEDPDPVPAARAYLGDRQARFYTAALDRSEELQATGTI
jgi:catechol 2,3-dioxygenase-like lactoylglutathione lyase family enzyme